MHWTDKYVGRECGPHIGFDCADLCELVQREVFGRTICLPSDKHYKQHPSNMPVARFHAMAQQIELSKSDYAVRTETPVEGDGVLIYTRGYKQHIGVYSYTQNEPWVIHASDLKRGPQVVFQRVRDMIARGLKIEGYYKWI